MKSCEIRPKFELMQFKVTSLGVNQKRIFNFPLVINSNFVRISYRLQDIDA